METVRIGGRRLCEICAKKELGDGAEDIIDTEYGGFIGSDAKFKCPAYDQEGSCQSMELSYTTFYMGSCCEPASKVLVENKNGKAMALLQCNFCQF